MEAIRIRQMSMCGIRLDALSRGELIELLNHAVLARDKLLILNHNLHSLYLYETNPAFRAVYALASCVYIDGLPVVWLGRAAGLPVTAAHRITFLDSFEAIVGEASKHGWRVFYLGSTEEVVTKALVLLRDRYPQLIIDGRNGFFAQSGPESEAVISQINDFRADILFVGMGMPLQEQWLGKHYGTLNVSAAMTSGATLDYIAGAAYRPPAWVGPLGLYGVFRMFTDPKRLWRRYLLEPLLLAKYLLPRLIWHWLGERPKTPALESLKTTEANDEIGAANV
jgi:N-acetylglucosaminyldiphosphoundecaprenol N-acetyl-beta-D-mannosaminyltransferase